MDRTLKLAIIIGSTREGRFGDTVGRWFAKEAARHGGFAIDLIDLIDIKLPPSHRRASRRRRSMRSAHAWPRPMPS